MVDFLSVAQEKSAESKPKVSTKPKRDYGLNEDGTKPCSKCQRPFVPNKFTPYQHICPDCGKKPSSNGIVTKAVGGGWIVTTCLKCGGGIRINRDYMTQYCNDHCDPEERQIRLEKLQESINKNLGAPPVTEKSQRPTISFGVDYKFTNDIVLEEHKQLKSGITLFDTKTLSEFKPSLEVIFLLLLAHGFKLSKSYILFKDYNTNAGIYRAQLLSPENGIMGFLISYNEEEKYKDSRGQIKTVKTPRSDIILNVSSLIRIPLMPPEMKEDITPLLELKASWIRSRIDKKEEK